MAEETYNGWANRETWALMLHINNDQGLHESYREHVQDATNVGREAWEIEDSLRDSITEMLDPVRHADEFGEPMPEALSMMAREVGSLWRIDWPAVRAALIED